MDGNPIKLLEFNADTPTMVYESAIVQWALLKKNGFKESLQFNSLYEALGDNFKRMITLGEDISHFNEIYEGWKILFSSIAGSEEEERTVKLLEVIAKEAGFETNFCYAHEATLSETEGLSLEGVNYEFWFKLIPWESIAVDEPELAQLMTAMIANKNTIFLNPAYTLMFQSKRMLKILWDLFPNHPLLLVAKSQCTSFISIKNIGLIKASIMMILRCKSLINFGIVVILSATTFKNLSLCVQNAYTLSLPSKGMFFNLLLIEWLVGSFKQ